MLTAVKGIESPGLALVYFKIAQLHGTKIQLYTV